MSQVHKLLTLNYTQANNDLNYIEYDTTNWNWMKQIDTDGARKITLYIFKNTEKGIIYQQLFNDRKLLVKYSTPGNQL